MSQSSVIATSCYCWFSNILTLINYDQQNSFFINHLKGSSLETYLKFAKTILKHNKVILKKMLLLR